MNLANEMFWWEHGTIIRTGITCKKIACYMCDSACRSFIVNPLGARFASGQQNFRTCYGKIECSSLVFALVVMIKVCFKKKKTEKIFVFYTLCKGNLPKSLRYQLATNTDSCVVMVLMHDLKIVENLSQVG